MLESTFGFLAMVFGFLSFIIGLTMQTIKQFREKRFGMHISFPLLGTAACLFRMIYSSLIGAWWIVPADVYGLLITTVILWQYGAYEKHWWGVHTETAEQ